MKSTHTQLKNLINYSVASLLLFSCSVDEKDLATNEDLNLTSATSSALTLSSNDIITLYSNGGYLSADNTYLKCKGSSANDDGEKFEIINHGNDVISLISLKTNKYVSSEFLGGTPMTANRSSAGVWEKFDIHYLGGNVVALSNTYLGSRKYMCSEGGIIDAAFSRTSVGGAWEKFTIEQVSNSDESFISTTDDRFTLDDFLIESSSHNSSSGDTSTDFWDYDDFSLSSTWYNLSGGDYYLTCAEEDGKRTEWKEDLDKSASLSKEKVMKYAASIDDIPKKGVTISQVHNRGDGANRPFLRVFIEDGTFMVKQTTNDLTKSSGSYYTIEGPSISENSKFKLQLTTGDEKVNVKIETDSGTLDKDFTPYTGGNYDDYKNDFYFKAGVYTEGNDTKPTIRFYCLEKSLKN